MYQVHVLFDGYSKPEKDGQSANCSCVLITGEKKMIIDTMTCWDGEKLLDALKKHSIDRSEINYVVSTHSHADHIGNNNLFLNATHIIGWTIHHKDRFIDHPFHQDVAFEIDENLTILPTPGHTLSDVSVVVKNVDNFGTIVIAGDLFEREDDLENDVIWISAGSEDIALQKRNRARILEIADFIVPGHGKMFKVCK